MTDETFRVLEELVDRTLRPVWTNRARKEMLRMELMAHVMDVFAEEFASLGDDHTALKQTIRRFGVAEQVGSELQSSLGLSDRWPNLFAKETLMSRWLWFVAIVAIFVGPAFIMPAVAQYRGTGVLQLFPLILGVVITLAGLAVAGYRIKQRVAHS